jgi:galactonate dehydratase
MAKIRSAGGEKLFGVKGFLPYVQAGAVDVLMPDVKLGGGLLQIKCIAALAEAAVEPTDFDERTSARF